MLPDAQNSKVFKPVIRTDTVDMIDVFPSFQRTPKMLLHQPAMFEKPSAVYRNTPVPSRIRNSLRLGVAGLRAKAFGLNTAWGQGELLMALVTRARHAAKVVGMATPKGFQPWSFNLWQASASQAASRAESCRGGTIREYGKSHPT